MEIFNEEEIRYQSNNEMSNQLIEESKKCVPYSWILINHYQLRKYISDNKMSEAAMKKEVIPFEVEILDKDHPHVFIDTHTRDMFYRKDIASYRDVKSLIFIDRQPIYLNLYELAKIVFNKSCTLNLKTRMRSDANIKERSSSSIMLELKNNSKASVIRNSTEVDMILKNVYAETVYKLVYVGKEDKRPSWLYPYPETTVDREVLKTDALKVIQSLQREVQQVKDEQYLDLLDDNYRRRR